VATRLFLRRLKTELRIPIFGLMDSDPYGLKILSVYMSGSKNMSYDSASLTTSDIKWLGVRPSDLDKYKSLSLSLSFFSVCLALLRVYPPFALYFLVVAADLRNLFVLLVVVM